MSNFDDLVGDALLPDDPAYTALDRYRDFRELFGSDLGNKVLKQILKMAHIGRPDAVVGVFDPHKAMFASGEKNLALRIAHTARVEPKPKPATATTTSPLHRRP